MSIFTLRYRTAIDDAQRSSIDRALSARGATTAWTISPRYARSYVAVGGSVTPADVPAEPAATAYDGALIAVAVVPNLPQALSALETAFGAAGRPRGVLAVEYVGDAAIVEWDPSCTNTSLVMATIDAELKRYGAARVTELLTPLSVDIATAVAADGLRAPEIAPDRVLETLIGSKRSDA